MNINPHLLGGQHNHITLTAKGEQQAHRLGLRMRAEGMKFDHSQ